ncbi:MAG: amidohydrolase [Oscillospiraceae bacterium]|nr:amidohydrolase [Oscillospiraceae bacterium]
MKIIDSHAHIFPQKISLKASNAIGEFYNIKMHHDGMAHILNELSRDAGISKTLVCSTATTPQQVEPINDFISEKCKKYKNFLGIATLHQDMEDPEREIERIETLGLSGIKLHPDFQKFCIDDEKMFPTYAILEKKRLPILFHTGDKRYDFSGPRRLIRIMEKFPDLICIAAHFGGYSEWKEAEEYPKSPNLFFDTSSSLDVLPKEGALSLIERFGVDQFMFGTDFPMWTPKEEIEKVLSLGLSDEDNKKVFSGNFERLFCKATGV